MASTTTSVAAAGAAGAAVRASSGGSAGAGTTAAQPTTDCERKLRGVQRDDFVWQWNDDTRSVNLVLEYDDAGRLHWVDTLGHDDQRYRTTWLGYEYLSSGRVDYIYVQNSRHFEPAYDATGRLVAAGLNQDDEGPYKTFDAEGRLLCESYASLEWGDSTCHEYTDNSDGRLDHVTTTVQREVGTDEGYDVVTSTSTTYYKYDFYPTGEVKARIVTDAERRDNLGALWFDRLGRPVFETSASAAAYRVFLDGREVLRFDPNLDPAITPRALTERFEPSLPDELFPVHPFDAAPSAVEAVDLELYDAPFGHFSISYDFDSQQRPTLVEYQVDGEPLLEVELVHCENMISETLRHAEGAFQEIRTNFHYACIDAEITALPPACE